MLFTQKIFKEDNFLQKITGIIFICLILWYVSLCVTHHFSMRPLWNDERAVFQSVEGLRGAEFFTQHLINGQTFPHLYLFFIQQIAKPWGFHLLILRLPSLICMLVGFFLWVKIIRKEAPQPEKYLVFLLSWCASVPLIYYASELKQYSMDVMASAVFLFFIVHQNEWLHKSKEKRVTLWLVLLPVLLLFSYTAYFLVLIPLYNLCLSLGKDLKVRRFIIIYLIAMICFAGLSYAVDIRLRPVGINTRTYGDHFIYYQNPAQFFESFGEGVNNLFSRWFAERPRVVRKIGWCFAGFGLIYLFYGFFAHIRRSKYFLNSLNTIAFVVFMELVVLGSLKKYPFSVPRTSLFYCPIVLFLTIQGISQTRHIHKSVYGIIYGLYIVFLLGVALRLTQLDFTGPFSFQPHLW